MSPRLTSIGVCAELAGLAAHEMLLGVSPGERHARLLAHYRRARSFGAARARIVADIRTAMRDGAAGRAADLLVVLRQLLAGCGRGGGGPASRRRPDSPRFSSRRPASVPAAAPQMVEGQVILLRPSRDRRAESVFQAPHRAND